MPSKAPTHKPRTVGAPVHKPWLDRAGYADRQRLQKGRSYQARMRLFRQANPLCAQCKRERKLTPSACVDHIKAIQDGGQVYDPANLQALCDSCHSKKTIAEQQGRGIGPFGRPVGR